jgi:hypothetical protein
MIPKKVIPNQSKAASEQATLATSYEVVQGRSYIMFAAVDGIIKALPQGNPEAFKPVEQPVALPQTQTSAETPTITPPVPETVITATDMLTEARQRTLEAYQPTTEVNSEELPNAA